jgi:hypothetical protein
VRGTGGDQNAQRTKSCDCEESESISESVEAPESSGGSISVFRALNWMLRIVVCCVQMTT